MADPVYDLAVIGSGPAGQKAAVAAAKLGKRVAVVDRPEMIGGVCIHTGTIPSKALREAMEAQPLDEAQVRGRALALGELKADGAVLRARIRSEIWPVLTAEQQQKAKDLRGLHGLKSKRRIEAFERWLRQDG